jgi:hypothetical protein
MTRVIRHIAAAALAASALIAGCGGGQTGSALKEIQRVKSGALDVLLLSDDGALNQGTDAFVIEFRNAAGALQDVGTVTTNANMVMPGMTMPGNVEVQAADQPGRYRANGDFGMAGGWQMKVEWSGPAGQGSAVFDGTVQ